MSFSDFPITLPSIPNPEHSPQEFVRLYSTLGSLGTPLAWLQARLTAQYPACIEHTEFVYYMNSIMPNLSPQLLDSTQDFDDIIHNLKISKKTSPTENYLIERPSTKIESPSTSSTVSPLSASIPLIESTEDLLTEIFSPDYHKQLIAEQPIIISGIADSVAELISITLLAYLHKVDLVKALGFPRINSQGQYDDHSWITTIAQMQLLQRNLAHHGSAGKLKANPALLFIHWKELGSLTAQYIFAASLGKPIIISDCISLLAITLAEELAPGIRNWCLLGSNNPYPIYELSAKKLFLEVNLDVQFDLLAPKSAMLFAHILQEALNTL